MLLMTTQDVMQYLSVSRDYVRWLRQYNLLKMWKMGNKWRTSLEDVNDFLELTRGSDLSGRGDVIQFALTHHLI